MVPIPSSNGMMRSIEAFDTFRPRLLHIEATSIAAIDEQSAIQLHPQEFSLIPEVFITILTFWKNLLTIQRSRRNEHREDGESHHWSEKFKGRLEHR